MDIAGVIDSSRVDMYLRPNIIESCTSDVKHIPLILMQSLIQSF